MDTKKQQPSSTIKHNSLHHKALLNAQHKTADFAPWMMQQAPEDDKKCTTAKRIGTPVAE